MKDPTPLIAAKDVTFGYEPGADVIKELSLNINPGEKYVFVGPNGAGKTTLANLLAGSLSPQSGRIEYRDDMLPSNGRKPIACVRQSLSVFPALTVTEHFRLLGPFQAQGNLAEEGRPTPEDCLRLVGAKFSQSAIVGNLPFSSRQLLEIALAFWQRARVLILDEPTSALDSAGVDALFRALENLARDGVAIVLISHNPQEIARLNAKSVVLGLTPAEDNKYPVPTELATNGSRQSDDSVSAQLPLGDGTEVTVPLHAGALTVLGFDDAYRRSMAWLAAVDGERATDFHQKSLGDVRAIPLDRGRFGIFPSLSALQNYQVLSGKADLSTGSMALPNDLARFSIILPSWSHNISALSGGNQQKLLVGSVLAGHPNTVLAEEPLLGLDQRAQTNVSQSFRDYLNQGGRMAVFTCFPEAYADLQPIFVLANAMKENS